MRALSLGLILCVAGAARAEPPTSPYRMRWQFVDEPRSAIDVDRGDLSVSAFHTDYELVRYLSRVKDFLPRHRRELDEASPLRQLCVEQNGADGRLRSTACYVGTLAIWRKHLGADTVERLEDEFDAHLRMVLPRKVAPVHPAAHGAT